MIVMNDYVFPFVIHGNPFYSHFERPLSVATWHGVIGAQIRAGRAKTREITIDVTLSDINTELLYNNIRRSLELKLDQGLYGELIVDATRFPKTLFMGYAPDAPHFWDGSGVHGWTQFGKLKFLNIAG